MLYVIETFPLCSLAGAQALQVLDALKKSFDLDDFEILKQFVIKQLGQNAQFTFESGNQTAAINLASLVQMGIELKNLS
jgi:hypothetical protein